MLLRARVVQVSSGLALASVPTLACWPGNSEWGQENAAAQAAIRDINRSSMEGALRVDDAPFPFDYCLSGDAVGLQGVELEGTDGSRLRLVQEADGTGTVIRMPTGAAPVTMKSCGTVAVERLREGQDGRYAFRGVARVDCASGASRVAGSVSFRCGVARPQP
jgi:hypothetical protein